MRRFRIEAGTYGGFATWIVQERKWFRWVMISHHRDYATCKDMIAVMKSYEKGAPL